METNLAAELDSPAESQSQSEIGNGDGGTVVETTSWRTCITVKAGASRLLIFVTIILSLLVIVWVWTGLPPPSGHPVRGSEFLIRDSKYIVLQKTRRSKS